jgi:hypothetical protein
VLAGPQGDYGPPLAVYHGLALAGARGERVTADAYAKSVRPSPDGYEQATAAYAIGNAHVAAARADHVGGHRRPSTGRGLARLVGGR